MIRPFQAKSETCPKVSSPLAAMETDHANNQRIAASLRTLPAEAIGFAKIRRKTAALLVGEQIAEARRESASPTANLSGLSRPSTPSGLSFQSKSLSPTTNHPTTTTDTTSSSPRSTCSSPRTTENSHLETPNKLIELAARNRTPASAQKNIQKPDSPENGTKTRRSSPRFKSNVTIDSKKALGTPEYNKLINKQNIKEQVVVGY